MAADDNQLILFNKIAHHRIKTKPGSVVVSQADPYSWILQKDHIRPQDSWDPSAISNLGDNCIIIADLNMIVQFINTTS